MSDQRVGQALRAVRLRRGWRQRELAQRSGVSASFVSLVERGHLDHVSLGALRRAAACLDVRVDLVARWRGGELDRLLNAAHSALHESVARHVGRRGGWDLAPEVSFSIYGERGVIDILAWHAVCRALLVIELKTVLVDVQEVIATLDRKRRLAPAIAAQRGWEAETVSAWLILVDRSTNRHRVAAHRTTLRAALPADGRLMRAWLRRPVEPVRALSFWPESNGGNATAPVAGVQRVRQARGGRVRA